MFVGADIETALWQGAGSEGMLGCSAGDGGRGCSVGLTGGKPGAVCCSLCSGASEKPLFGVGASGNRSSLVVTGNGRFNSGTAGSGRALCGSADEFRCAAELKHANEKITTALARWRHFRNGLRSFTGMRALL
jgi:hypothetical protein